MSEMQQIIYNATVQSSLVQPVIMCWLLLPIRISTFSGFEINACC